MLSDLPVRVQNDASCCDAAWNYDLAFSRNRGLVTGEEQMQLRCSRVAIAGLGGVGGAHLATLVRLGVGNFTIADPDHFEVANFNRQYGATISHLGRDKASVMRETVHDINPRAMVRVFDEPICNENAVDFLGNADLLIDGLDFFAIQARRALFQRAAEKGIPALTAAPLGFSTAWLLFMPGGMPFDTYFDLHDQQTTKELLAGFAVGLAPRATHLDYMDFSKVNLETGAAPSSVAACNLAAGVIGVEAMKILLGRPGVRPAPYYHQFDAYRSCLRTGRLILGNRHPFQRLKRHLLLRRFTNF